MMRVSPMIGGTMRHLAITTTWATRRLSLALVLLSCLCACGGGSDAGAAPVTPTPTPPPTAAPKTSLLTSGLSSPWGLAFLPDGRMLITQKGGTMVIASADGRTVSAPFSAGLPNLTSAGQGG